MLEKTKFIKVWVNSFYIWKLKSVKEGRVNKIRKSCTFVSEQFILKDVVIGEKRKNRREFVSKSMGFGSHQWLRNSDLDSKEKIQVINHLHPLFFCS